MIRICPARRDHNGNRMTKVSFTLIYQSNIPFQTEPLDTIAVYCSDGWFGDQTESFLTTGLGLRRFDRLVVPGGAACLVRHHASQLEDETILARLRFLIESHELNRVILVAHDDCGYYKAALSLPADQQEQPKRNDLAMAAKHIAEINPRCDIQAYIARLDGYVVRFEAVTLNEH